MKTNTKRTKNQWALLITGLTVIIAGLSILGFYGVRKISRDIHRQQLMKENVVVEIPDLKIKAPVLEGTDNETLSKATGHFTDTGTTGKGNYCIAGHSSTIYKEYFNNLKKIQKDTEIILYDKEKNKYLYSVSDVLIVNPNETWILSDFGDDRVTIVTCTDDGTQRLVVIGKKIEPEK